jgi:hypothetical protein
LKVIFDLPYDWHQYIGTEGPIFFLSQYADEYRGTETLKYMSKKGIFLDNGAYDFQGPMPVIEYEKVVQELKPEVIVVPDVLGDMKETIAIAKQFFDNHQWVEGSTYILPLQGRTVNEFSDMVEWYYKQIIGVKNKVVFSLSKGMPDMMLSNRNWVLSELRALHSQDKISFPGMHFFGYNFGVVEDRFNVTSIDTKCGIKKCLKQGNIKCDDYYKIMWNDIDKLTQDSIKFNINLFKEMICLK